MRNATADERKKIIELINKNKSMFYMSEHAKSDRITITDTTDIRPGYGAESYVAVLPVGKKNSVEWYNPSGDRRDDWHWGHSTIIVTNKDFTKVRKVRGMYSAEDKPGNRKYSCNRKTNRKKESRAERREDSHGRRDVDLRRKADEAHRKSEKYRRAAEESRREAERRADEARQRTWQSADKIHRKTDGAERVQSRIARKSVQRAYTAEPATKNRSTRIEGLFKNNTMKSVGVKKVTDSITVAGITISFMALLFLGLLVSLVILAATVPVAIGTGAFLGKRTKTVWNPDEYNWVPDKLLDALENDETHDGAIERMDDIKLIVESGASDENKNSSIERVLASIKTDEAPEKDTTAGDFLVDKIADMWDK